MQFDKEKIKKEVISYILIFLGVFGFKSTFFEPNHIPSGSMLPTMAIGDFILVNKFSYGLKLPFSEWVIVKRMLGREDAIYLTEFTPPKKGDIIVFEYPEDRDILFVKRVVATPGDEIQVTENRVFLNGKEIIGEEQPQKPSIDLYDYPRVPMDMRFLKVNSGETSHIIGHNLVYPPPGRKKNQESIKVPKDHVFVMGDNRDFSSDSRFWGFVPYTHLRGKAMFVWFNMVYPWSEEPFHFRPARIGTSFGSLNEAPKAKNDKKPAKK